MAKHSEPMSFGKPVLILVLAGIGFGGYWFYKNWPTSFESNGLSVNFPPHWKIAPNEGRFVGAGPLGNKRPTGDYAQGSGMITLTPHGNVSWPDMLLKTFTSVPETQEEIQLDYKNGLLVTYTDGDYKYMGVVLDRVDVFVTYVIGCKKADFETHRKLFDKCVRSLRCYR